MKHLNLSRLLPLLLTTTLGLVHAAHAQTITVDWGVRWSKPTAKHFGMNVWSGMDADVAENAAYQQRIADLKISFFRFHSNNQVKPRGTSGQAKQSWITSNNWDYPHIERVLNAFRDNVGEKMINIAGPPPFLDSNLDGKPENFEAYATFCGNLVAWCSSKGYGIKYWELYNEKDTNLTKKERTLLFVKCKAAVKAADSTAIVVGPVYADPYNTGNAYFRDNSGFEAWSFHKYGLSTSGGSYPGILSEAIDVHSVGQYLKSTMSPTKELFCTETNIYDVATKDTNIYMPSGAGATWIGLMFRSVVDGWRSDTQRDGTKVQGVHIFNDADGRYGLMNTDYSGLRPSGYLTRLAIDRFVGGDSVQNTSSDQSRVRAFAVRKDSRRALMLLNMTDSPQTVSLSFLNSGLLASRPYTRWIVTGNTTSNYTGTTLTYPSSGAPQSITINPREVHIYSFSTTAWFPFVGAWVATPAR